MNLLPAFSIPIWETLMPNFEKYRDNWIHIAENLRSTNPDCASTYNVGGAWLSTVDALQDSTFHDLWPFLVQVGHKASFDLQFYPVEVGVTGAWFSVTQGRSAMHLPHTLMDIFAGVLFVKSPPGTGATVITNPGMNGHWMGNHLVDTKNKLNSERLRIEPTEGKIFIWPSYLPHATEPNQHDDVSIMINFRIMTVPKQPMPNAR